MAIHDKMKRLEDLPDELIQNVLNFLELPDLLSCGLVSKRVRSVSFIESLWEKIDIVNSGKRKWKIVPTDLLKRIINRGCKSLSLRGCKVTGNLKYSDFNLDLNYWNYRFTSVDQKILSYDKEAQIDESRFKSRSDSADYLSKYVKNRYKQIISFLDIHLF